MPLTWKRVRPGRQESTCGRYAVERDGYAGIGKSHEYCQDDGWIALDYTDGSVDGRNLDWFDTMREAKAECERHSAKSKELWTQRDGWRIQELREKRDALSDNERNEFRELQRRELAEVFRLRSALAARKYILDKERQGT